MTASVSCAGREPGEYAHLVAVQRRYATLAADDPDRPQLREQLISGYLPLAERLARRFAGRGEPLEDLVQVASVGLIHAVDRFDPERGADFLFFAVPTITGELRRYFRDHGWSMQVPRRLKDLHLAIRNTQAELSQQLGRAPRPSEIADRLEPSLPCLPPGYRVVALGEVDGMPQTPLLGLTLVSVIPEACRVRRGERPQLFLLRGWADVAFGAG
ncbi:MAG TPA: sigma-70 family RNA polymerase sigma factor [Pseudonocardiaceae bacterium]|nr:sigma-70 family RNA polymerase sigma factor [Pseudonocardiaceae bacterium]